MTGWLSLSEAALCRGVSTATVRNALGDGKVRWRWGRSPTKPQQRRYEVWWPDVERCAFPGKGNAPGAASGPVTSATWSRFCEVFDRVVERMREEDRA